MSINSYWFQTYMHEIGHALGLGHAGNYNSSASFSQDAKFSADSWQASVMSYFDQEMNPNTKADFAYTATLMPADIIAIQRLYGTDFETREGNTTYGAKTNVGGYLGDLMKMAFGEKAAIARVFIDNPMTLTIFDTGGRDTLNFAPSRYAQTINLQAGGVSDIMGMIGNVQIARGVMIENAIGGTSRDKIIGNVRDNVPQWRNGE